MVEVFVIHQHRITSLALRNDTHVVLLINLSIISEATWKLSWWRTSVLGLFIVKIILHPHVIQYSATLPTSTSLLGIEVGKYDSLSFLLLPLSKAQIESQVRELIFWFC